MTKRDGVTEESGPASLRISVEADRRSAPPLAFDLDTPSPDGKSEALVSWLTGLGDEASPAARYAAAVVLAGAATFIALLLDLVSVRIGIFSVPMLAVVIATFFGGYGPGLVAAGVTVLLLQVTASSRVGVDLDRAELLGFVMLLVASLIGGVLSNALRQSRARAVQLAEQRQRLLRSVLDHDRQLHGLADAMPVLVARSAPDGRFDYFNKALLDFTGKTQRELEGTGWMTFVHPDDRAEEERCRRRRRDTGEGDVVEQRLLRNDGVYRWHLVVNEPVRADGCTIRYWLCAKVDIHDRKVAEEALQVSEQRWRSFAEGLDVLYAEADAGGTMIYYSQRWTDYAGKTMEELVAAPMSVVHPDDRARIAVEWADALANGKALRWEWRARRHDGAYRWHMAFTSPLRDALGDVTSWVGGMVDIHDRKMMEEQLTDREELYRTLADSMEAIVCTSSRDDGRLDFFNKRFYEYTGLTPDAMPHHPLRSVIHPDDKALALRHWDLARSGEESHGLEARLRRYDGAYRWHLARFTPLVATDRAPAPWMVTLVDIHERRVFEEALRESETRYRSLVEAAPVFVYNADPSGRLTFASESYYEYTGRPRDGQNEPAVGLFREVVHPHDLPSAVTAWSRALVTSEKFELELRLRGSDGGYHWFLTRVIPTQDEAGTVTAWVGTSTNIDDRRRAEDALRDSRERYRTLSDTVPALITTHAADGTFLFGNQHYFRYTGMTEEQARDWPHQGIIHPDDREGLYRRAADDLAPEHGPIEAELRLLRHDGQYRWHAALVQPLRDERNELNGWMSVNVDIHDRKAGELRASLLAGARSLLATSLDYQETLDNLVKLLVPRVAEWAAIHVREDDGTIRRVALAFSEPSMQAYADAGNAIDPQGSAGIARVLRTGEPEVIPVAEERHYTSIRADVRDRVRVSGMKSSIMLPLRYHGKTNGALAINSVTPGRFAESDLAFGMEFAAQAAVTLEHARLYSELQRTAADLRSANDAKDEFLGLVSHELKTPVTTILGNAEVLRRRGDKLDAAARTSSLDDIHQDAARLHQIIDNLLILARLERGRDIEMEPLLARRIVEKLAEDHRRRYPYRELRVFAPEAATPVMATDVYLEQVIRNLLSNAEKYSPPHLAIEVQMFRDGEHFKIDVLDRGEGVPSAEREHIFDPFYRSPRAEHVAGVGIGLAACRRLMEAQGGSIEYLPRDGGGSCFHVSLALYKEDLVGS